MLNSSNLMHYKKEKRKKEKKKVYTSAEKMGKCPFQKNNSAFCHISQTN